MGRMVFGGGLKWVLWTYLINYKIYKEILYISYIRGMKMYYFNKIAFWLIITSMITVPTYLFIKVWV